MTGLRSQVNIVWKVGSTFVCLVGKERFSRQIEKEGPIEKKEC